MTAALESRGNHLHTMNMREFANLGQAIGLLICAGQTIQTSDRLLRQWVGFDVP